ncbi:MAG: NAD(P)-dependent alcohol dehydrogenase [Ilumatobacteraceae bacterium]
MTTTTRTTPKDEATDATTMQAIVQDEYGSADVLRSEPIGRPTIDADQVLVEVHAAGIDRGVWHLVTGQPYLVRVAGYGLSKPKQRTPGLDVAGRVVAVGADVSRFAVGDEVFGIADGSFAEYAAADEDKLVHKPGNVSFEAAGAAAVSGITALQALTDVGGVEAGQHVLIVGASGGVGSFAVQLAKALGAHVTGVAGTQNLDLVRSLGADHVVDHRTEDFAATDRRYDLILDIGGRNSVRRLRSVLTPNGTLVIVGGEGGNKLTGGIGRQLRAVLLSPFVKQRLTMFISKEHHSFMDRLARYLASGEVVPSIGRRFELDEVPDAVREMEAGRLSGKSVIVVR